MGYYSKGSKSERRQDSPHDRLRIASSYVLEQLESRLMLAANSWTNANGGDWDNAANWSLGHVPTATEDAVITLPGNYTVTHGSGATDTVKSVISDAILDLAAGTLNVLTTIQVNAPFLQAGGTLGSGTILQGNGSESPFIPGKLGTALNLGTNSRYVSIPNPADHHLDLGQNATIQAWVQFTSTPQAGVLDTIVAKDQGPGQVNKFIFSYAASYDGYIDVTLFHINSPSTGDIWLPSNAWVPVVGQWYNIAVVKTGLTYSFYLNGVADGTAQTSVNVPAVSAPLTLGYSEGNYYFPGIIDDVRLWNIPLTATNVSQEMGSELTGSETGLVGYWKMDEVNGSTVADSTSYQSIGQIVGSIAGAGELDYYSGTLANVTLDGQIWIEPNASLKVSGVLTINGGSIVAASGAVKVNGSVAVDGTSALVNAPGETYDISGNLLGPTTNAAQFAAQATVVLNGTGTSSAPQQLEVMGQDLGAVEAGFANNFAYGSLQVTGSTYVQLVDQSQNAPLSGPEALYVNSLSVASGATLNLNGLHLYAGASQISGHIVNGSVTPVPSGGAIALDTQVPGDIAAAGNQETWTFYGEAGRAIAITLDTGSAAVLAPALGWAQVELLSAAGTVLASTQSSSADQTLTLSVPSLPSDGTYEIRVTAAPGEPNSTGNCALSLWDVTPTVSNLTLNDSVSGRIQTPYSADQWTFAGLANEAIKFDLINRSDGTVGFNLTGPNGWTGFANLSDSSDPITLPSSGTYTLTVHGTGGSYGETYAFEVEQSSIATLAPGQSYTGQFAASAQSQLFEINVPQSEQLNISLQDSADNNITELYARFGAPPTRGQYDLSSTNSGSANQTIFDPSAYAGTWYVLVYANTVRTPGSYTLTATTASVSITSITPDHYAATSDAQITVTGAGFINGTTVSLVSQAGTSYPASSVSIDSTTQLTATFAAGSVPAGTKPYSLTVTSPGSPPATLPNCFTMKPSGQANFSASLILPGSVGYFAPSTIFVQYSNTGNMAMPAPLLEITAEQDNRQAGIFFSSGTLVPENVLTSAAPEGSQNVAQILASGATPGVLEPGESMKVPIEYVGFQKPWDLSYPPMTFSLKEIQAGDTTPVDWASMEASMQPAGVPATAWGTIFSNLTTQLGTTAGAYVQLLDNEASYLGNLGENVTDTSSLWSFAVQQADNALNPIGPYVASATDDSLAMPGSLSLDFSRVFASDITGRDTMGPLGMGWSTPWQTSASVASDGTVTVSEPAGAQRIFQPDSRAPGAYFSSPGDTGTLAADASGGYLLTEADGTATDYGSNGALNYMQDTDGNRITAGYTSERLASLTASSGQSIVIGYNAAGLISTVSDSEGRVTTYAYDSSNQYLTSVTGFNGQTTTYAYNTTSGSPAQNALTTITFPGNTHQYFTYDNEGRLATTYQDGGAQPLSFAYTLGQVSVTDGATDTSNLYYNEQGLATKFVDPLGNATYSSFDSDFNLAQITNAIGQSETYTYNSAGEPTSSTDFLGNTTDFTYSGPFNELSSMTDANGNTTDYSYDTSGDLLSINYANNTSERFTYDPEGDATAFVNPNGQATGYTHNSAGQVTGATFSDGSKYTYTYDSHGNLATAVSTTAGTVTFTYDQTTDLLTKVAYSNGDSLTFTYNAAGQRTQMVDQTGFTTNYLYDSVGRLSELTDGGNNPIVTYTYDSAGRLSEKVNGNGTYTKYAYDADGNILTLINYAPAGSVNSSFSYSYSSLGLETGETTLQGSWTYTYDADGQLTQAVFASNNTAVIPNQNLSYSYDSLGNRTVTVINGITTTYATNSVNEYTSVGGVAYSYDKNGNLLSDGTNTYTYNSQNELASVSGSGGTTTYAYNALGQLVSSTANGQTTEYLIDPAGLANVVGTYNGGGSLIADYTYGLGLTSQVSTGGTYFYDFDALGSSADITTSSGAIINAYSYLPFGGNLSSSAAISNSFHFGGQLGVWNDLTGLESMRARVYSPSTGRFESRDPLGVGGNDGNVYRYAANDPVSYVDPLGLSTIESKTADAAGAVFDFTGAIQETPGLKTLGAAMSLWASTSENPNNFTKAAFEAAGSVVGGTLVGDIFEGLGVVGGFAAGEAIEPFGGGFPGAFLGGASGAAVGGFVGGKLGGWAGDGLYYLWSLLNPPQPTDGNPVSTTPVLTHGAVDPNSLVGPAGYSSQNFVADTASLPYQINFENSPFATAPAQQVTITDQLDPNLNWSTFSLTGAGFGDNYLNIPVGTQHYQSVLPITENGETIDVEINAGINLSTGMLTAIFTSIDPQTGLPPDVATGFLPPENGTGRGMGYLSFLVQPMANLATGTQIRDVAGISFDGAPIITTDQVNDENASQGTDPTKEALITIDSGAPTSAVAALPPIEESPSFAVSWSGQDDAGGSGIATYSVYVSDNGGSYQPFLTNTTNATATFTGQPGHTYSFYSVATDNVGNVQPTPAGAQATTFVGGVSTAFSGLSAPATIIYGAASTTFGGTIAAGATYPPDTETVAVTLNGVTIDAPINTNGQFSATFNTTALPVSTAAYQVSYQYTGDSTFAPASDNSTTTLTVTKATPVFSGLNSPTLTYGTASTTLSGKLSLGTLAPTGDVVVALDGMQQSATIGSDGTFSATLGTAALPASTTPYVVTYSYAGDSNFNAAGDNSDSSVTVSKATPTLTLPTSASFTYDGTGKSLTATLTGIAGAAAPTGTISYLYYTGTAATGAALSAAPVNAGTYTVMASYAGDANYLAAQTSVTFTVNRAATTTTLASPPPSITADGSTDVTSWVTASVTGIAGAPAPSGLPTFTYYLGSPTSGTLLTSSPTTAGSYTVVASYAGNSNYLPSSASTPFTIKSAVGLTTSMLVNGVASTGAIANTQRSQVTSLVINFNAPVTLSAGAITLTDQDSTNPFGGAGASVPFTLVSSNGGATYTLSFSGTGFVSRGSLPTSLPNGHYVLSVLFSQVSSATAAVPAGTQSLKFHRLYGDLTNAGYITTVTARADASAANWASYQQYLDNDGAAFSAGFDSSDNTALTAAETFVTGTQEQTLWNLYNN